MAEEELYRLQSVQALLRKAEGGAKIIQQLAPRAPPRPAPVTEADLAKATKDVEVAAERVEYQQGMLKDMPSALNRSLLETKQKALAEKEKYLRDLLKEQANPTEYVLYPPQLGRLFHDTLLPRTRQQLRAALTASRSSSGKLCSEHVGDKVQQSLEELEEGRTVAAFYWIGQAIVDAELCSTTLTS